VVVTTHSTQLVDAMTNHADSVVIAEKDEATTGVRRLDQADIDRWREFGSLGALWTSGHFGGNRW
jgi:predicted ATPase